MNEETNIETVPEDDWDDIDLSDITDSGDAPDDDEETEDDVTAETEEADQHESEEAEEPGEVLNEPEEQAEADHSLTLKYMGEEKTVSRDEAVALAQKGMDYDRVKAKLDERDETISFLSELAKQQGLTLDEFIDNTHAALLSKREGLDATAALGRVRLERRQRELDAKEARLKDAEQAGAQLDAAAAKRKQDIDEFRREYPDVKADTIPKEVWDGVARGLSLTAAYTKHENARIKAELEAEKQAKANAAKTTGSRESAGQAKTKPDPWLDGWDDD